MIVEWRPVAGYEGLYEVSSSGLVRRVGRAARTGAGRGGGARIGRILRTRTVSGGYLTVGLWRDGRPAGRLISRLVAEAFLGPPPAPGYTINHRDGVKTNNNVSNLEWATSSENNKHAYDSGLKDPAKVRYRRGESHHNARLTEEQVAEIRRRYQPGVYGTPRLSREFGVNAKTIYNIVSGRTWQVSQHA